MMRTGVWCKRMSGESAIKCTYQYDIFSWLQFEFHNLLVISLIIIMMITDIYIFPIKLTMPSQLIIMINY